MIKVDFDKKTGKLITCIRGDSELTLFELNILINKFLEIFNAHGQVSTVLDEILDVVSDFAEEHTPKTKGEKKDD